GAALSRCLRLEVSHNLVAGVPPSLSNFHAPPKAPSLDPQHTDIYIVDTSRESDHEGSIFEMGQQSRAAGAEGIRTRDRSERGQTRQHGSARWQTRRRACQT